MFKTFWSGRVNRREFAIESMAIYGFWLSISLAAAHFAGASGQERLAALLFLIISAVFAIAGSRSLARRAHDAGWSAAPPLAVYAIALAPLFVSLAGLGGLGAIAGYGVALATMLVFALCFPAGQTGENRFGPAPLRLG